MRKDKRGIIARLASFILILSIVLLQSCTTTSHTRIEGNDFNKKLVGKWEGRGGGSKSREYRIEITEVDELAPFLIP